MSTYFVYGPYRPQCFLHYFFSAGDAYKDRLTSINRDEPCATHVVVDYKKFADEELDMTVFQLHSMTGARVVYFANWSKPELRYADYACLLAIAEMKPLFLTIVIPFFPTGTMEREEHEGSVCTANTDAKLLSSLPCSSKRVIFIDVHTVTNQFYFHDTVVTLESCMPYVVKTILPFLPPPSGECGSKAVIVFPDDGALKRFKRFFVGYEMVACGKVRGEGDKRTVTLGAQDELLVKGRAVLIVDDLVRSGNTLIECAKVLRTASVASVTVFVPHAVFPRDEYNNVQTCGVFDKFIVTDSVPETTAKLNLLPLFQVIPLALILKTIVKP
jgi:phosphoribosylpyrophosphate synthetase